MALPVDSFIVAFDQLSDDRREVAHALIKAKANGWWHNLPNVWIAGGHDAAFWRDELKPVIEGTGASMLVLHLPPDLRNRSWAFFGTKSEEKTRWLRQTYSGIDPGET